MPTGYTAPIADGITFQQFALSCARAFGAMITMRDEPADAPIPDEFKPSDYHSRAVETAKGFLAEFLAMSPEQAEAAALHEYQGAESHRLQSLEEKKQLEAKYREMLEAVTAWQPPSADHVRLREFMVEQIIYSIKFDCDCNYYSNPVERMTGAEWLEAQIGRAKRDIIYHTEEHAKEVERCRKRSEWVQQLRASLSPAGGAV